MSFSIHIKKFSDTVILFEQTNHDLNDIFNNLSFKLKKNNSEYSEWYIGVSLPCEINIIGNTIEIDMINEFTLDPTSCVFPATRETSMLFANYIKDQLSNKYNLTCTSIINELDFSA